MAEPKGKIKENTLQGVKIYTDGSSIGNPGPGGRGVAVLVGAEQSRLPSARKTIVKEKDGSRKKTQFSDLVKKFMEGRSGDNKGVYDVSKNGKSKVLILSGGEPRTTNNRMELMAVIEALKWVKRVVTEGFGGMDAQDAQNGNDVSTASQFGASMDTSRNRVDALGSISFYMDSKYVYDGIVSYLPSWAARGWRLASKKPVLNKDLRIDVPPLLADIAAYGLVLQRNWVKGHADDKMNALVDKIARRDAMRQPAPTLQQREQLRSFSGTTDSQQKTLF